MAPRYLFRQMDDADAREISGWRYEPPYDFYDTTNDLDHLAELLDPERRDGGYFAAFDESRRLWASSSSRRKAGAWR